MAFFGNDAVNRVNLHYGVQAVAMGAGGVFLLTFLIHAGVSVPGALLAFTGALASSSLRFTFSASSASIRAARSCSRRSTARS